MGHDGVAEGCVDAKPVQPDVAVAVAGWLASRWASASSSCPGNSGISFFLPPPPVGRRWRGGPSRGRVVCVCQCARVVCVCVPRTRRTPIHSCPCTSNHLVLGMEASRRPASEPSHPSSQPAERNPLPLPLPLPLQGKQHNILKNKKAVETDGEGGVLSTRGERGRGLLLRRMGRPVQCPLSSLA